MGGIPEASQMVGASALQINNNQGAASHVFAIQPVPASMQNKFRQNFCPIAAFAERSFVTQSF